MMALDGKTIIKEEITDKDAYEATAAAANSTRRIKANSSNAGSGKDNTGSGGTTASNSTTSNAPNANTTTSSSSSSSGSNSERNSNSANSSRTCRTPDSPESARAIAPRSPISPQLQHHPQPHPSLAPPQRPNRNASASPVVNGATTTTTPPLPLTPGISQAATQAALVAAQVAQVRKLRKFLGSLVQLAQEVHPEVSERVRTLVVSLAAGSIAIDEFRLALQEAINLPLRPYVIPLLKNHLALLQRDIATLARATNQTALQYVTSNENAIMEFGPHGPPSEYSDIFMHHEAGSLSSVAAGAVNGSGATSLFFKRRSSDTLMEHQNGAQDWSDYMAVAAYPPAKRAMHAHSHQQQMGGLGPADVPRVAFAGGGGGGSGGGSGGQATIYDYSTTGGNAGSQSDASFGCNHRERDEPIRAMAAAEALRHAARSGMAQVVRDGGGGGGGSSAGGGTAIGGVAGPGSGGAGAAGGEEEWKNIHTMLNCISAMVDKTKRAITILQQRGAEAQQLNYSEVTPAALAEIRRQTEEKVVEFKRNAEEAVNQVKRQAVIEIQRAVCAAETRSAEVMAQERLRMEKFFVEMSRHSGGSGGGGSGSGGSGVGGERDHDNKSPTTTIAGAGQNACWNCGRKATETCSGCNLARYCGAFCQHKDWEHHHQICGTTRSTDLSTKHGSQVIPLSATIRGNLARTPPMALQQAPASAVQSAQAQAASSSSVGVGVGVAQSSALVANGIGSK